jgi:hypothetical protein
MARRKNADSKSQAVLIDIQEAGDLTLRLEKVAEQTGLSPMNLLQKWILQEETLIGLMQQHNKNQITSQAQTKVGATPQQKPATKRAKKDVAPLDPNDPNYIRKALIERVMELKNDGMAYTKIAQALNDEKAPTLSGTGKWYASSVTNLLKSKAKA